MTKIDIRLENKLCNLGFTLYEVKDLVRISRRLNKFYDSNVYFHEDLGYYVRHYDIETTVYDQEKQKYFKKFTSKEVKVRDYETGRIKALKEIMKDKPELNYFIQTDPRGCSLYIYKKEALKEDTDIESVYSSISIAVY